MNGQLSIEPGLGYLSWSRLNKYNNCGEQFRLIYVEGITDQEPSGAALAGRAMHAAIRDAEANESWADPDDTFTMPFAFSEYFAQYVEEAGGPDACRWSGRKDRDGRPNEDYQWWVQYAGPLFCNRFAAVRLEDEKQGCRLVDAEFEVSVDVAGRNVVGYIDSLMVNADGEAVIRDWKSGKMLDPYQLGVYSWMLENSERHITADIGHIGYLRGNTLGDQLKVYDIRAWRELVPRLLNDLVRGVEGGIFPLRPSPFCVACSVRVHCEYGRTLDA